MDNNTFLHINYDEKLQFLGRWVGIDFWTRVGVPQIGDFNNFTHNQSKRNIMVT